MTRPRLSDYVLGLALVLALLAGSTIATPQGAPQNQMGDAAGRTLAGAGGPAGTLPGVPPGVPSPSAVPLEAASAAAIRPEPAIPTPATSIGALYSASGIGTHMGNAPVGPAYLALPIGPGYRVRLCGVAACLTVMSTDAGPDLAMQRAGRVADLSVELFERICGCPASRGLANVSWTVVPDQHPQDPPEHPDDARMRLDDR